MNSLRYCMLLLCLSLAAQSVQEDQPDAAAVTKLNSTLLTLKHAGVTPASVGQQLVNDIISLAETTHEPSRATVVKFTDQLINELSARELPAKLLSQVTTAILVVLHSAVTPAYEFRASIGHAREALISLGVSAPKAQAVAERLMAVGKEVRGPEDIGVAR